MCSLILHLQQHVSTYSLRSVERQYPSQIFLLATLNMRNDHVRGLAQSALACWKMTRRMSEWSFVWLLQSCTGSRTAGLVPFEYSWSRSIACRNRILIQAIGSNMFLEGFGRVWDPTSTVKRCALLCKAFDNLCNDRADPETILFPLKPRCSKWLSLCAWLVRRLQNKSIRNRATTRSKAILWKSFKSQGNTDRSTVKERRKISCLHAPRFYSWSATEFGVSIVMYKMNANLLC